MNNRRAGIEGESVADEYLKNIGYRILDRNFSTKVGEIDIVARDGNTLVFIEVKARDSVAFGRPVESITRAAQWYLIAKRKQNCLCRFDVIEVLRGQVNHIKNAFEC